MTLNLFTCHHPPFVIPPPQPPPPLFSKGARVRGQRWHICFLESQNPTRKKSNHKMHIYNESNQKPSGSPLAVFCLSGQMCGGAAWVDCQPSERERERGGEPEKERENIFPYRWRNSSVTVHIMVHFLCSVTVRKQPDHCCRQPRSLLRFHFVFPLLPTSLPCTDAPAWITACTPEPLTCLISCKHGLHEQLRGLLTVWAPQQALIR